MPSFLNKVFGRKKSVGKDHVRTSNRISDPSLLEGKFEAVPPNVSPSATRFAEAAAAALEKAKEKESGGFALFRPKSRAQSPPPRPSKPPVDVPRLTLNLPLSKDEQSRALGDVFEAETTAHVLPDQKLNEYRLTPVETLRLTNACTKAITERGGLEAPGVMRPHWYSASADVQRRLISLYVLSLASTDPSITLTLSSPTSAIAEFESELQYTRSPHDIAALLRWGLRHLTLEGDSFGKAASSQDEWKWYQNFYDAERSASYPANAFSDNLIPHLPPPHANILIATLDIISSLASHAEANGFSGSKLSKFFGLWILAVRRSEEADDWSTFYARWERAGRIMEHLFLSWIRNEAVKNQMPRRLLGLVDHYPYSTPSQTSDGILSRPRFSTRRYDALFVRIETVLPKSMDTMSSQHPVRLINDALNSDTNRELGVHLAFWKEIIQSSTGSGVDDRTWAPILSRIFSDDTIGLLSLVPSDSGSDSFTVTFQLPKPNSPVRTRAHSVGSSPNGHAKRPVSNGDSTPAVSHTPFVPTRISPSVPPPVPPKDWAEFSTAGFGESGISRNFASTLLDKDIEVTEPAQSRKPTKIRKLSSIPPSPAGGRKSLDMPTGRMAFPEGDNTPSTVSNTTVVKLVELDEAFIDFWSDALLDSISSSWPKFVVGQLRRSVEIPADGGGSKKVINWIIIEQTFTQAPYAPPSSPEEPVISPSASETAPATAVATPGKRSTSSPRASTTSNLSFTAAVKRLTLFGSQDGKDAVKKETGKKKIGFGGKSPKIGELGEILPGELQEKKVAAVGDAVAAIAERGEKEESTVAVLKDEAPVTEYVAPLPAVVEQLESDEPMAQPDVLTKAEEYLSHPPVAEPESVDVPVAEAPEPVLSQFEVGVVAPVLETELEAEAEEHVSTPIPEPVTEPVTYEEPVTQGQELEAAVAEPAIEAVSSSVPEPETSEVLVTAEPEPAVEELEAEAVSPPVPEPDESEVPVIAEPEPAVEELEAEAASLPVPEPEESEVPVTAEPEPAVEELEAEAASLPVPEPEESEVLVAEELELVVSEPVEPEVEDEEPISSVVPEAVAEESELVDPESQVEAFAEPETSDIPVTEGVEYSVSSLPEPTEQVTSDVPIPQELELSNSEIEAEAEVPTSSDPDPIDEPETIDAHVANDPEVENAEPEVTVSSTVVDVDIDEAPESAAEQVEPEIVPEPLEPESQPEEEISAEVSPDENTEVLPPALEKVVRLGETPGPQLVLDSTEVDTAELPDAEEVSHDPPQITEEVESVDTSEFELPSSEPVIEYLSSEVDASSSAGVELAEVPILSQPVPSENVAEGVLDEEEVSAAEPEPVLEDELASIPAEVPAQEEAPTEADEVAEDTIAPDVEEAQPPSEEPNLVPEVLVEDSSEPAVQPEAASPFDEPVHEDSGDLPADSVEVESTKQSEGEPISVPEAEGIDGTEDDLLVPPSATAENPTDPREFEVLDDTEE